MVMDENETRQKKEPKNRLQMFCNLERGGRKKYNKVSA